MERILRENGFDQATVKVFIDNNVDMEVFSSLQSADFQELGITSFGLRRKLQLLQVSSICG